MSLDSPEVIDEAGADSTHQYRLALTLGRASAKVALIGEIDLLAAPSLSRLLTSLDVLEATVNIDMSAVSFLDSSGVTPLVDAAIRRQAKQLPPVAIVECSRRARQLLDCADLGGNPYIDPTAWLRRAETS